MDRSKVELSLWADGLLRKVVEENRYRETEIMLGVDGEYQHAKAVLAWIEKLTDNPSDTLKTAALLHDIDRLVTPGVGGGFKGDRNSQEYLDHKKAHALRSANFVRSKLVEKFAEDNDFIKRVQFLIAHHDGIGPEIESFADKDLFLLVAADGLAFFNTIAEKLLVAESEERLKGKVRFMLGKMPSFALDITRKTHLENPKFEKVKNEVIAELKI